MQLVQNQVLVADTDTITFSGLDGDNDGIYYLVIQGIKGGAGLTTYSLQPQGSNTNCTSCTFFIPIGTQTAYPSDIVFVKSGSGDGATFTAVMTITAKTGALRMVVSDGIEFGAGASFRTVMGGTWNDNSTNITSLVLKADVANAFKAGTIATLYKISQV